MYKLLIRKLLFLLQPEVVHDLIVFILKIPPISKILGVIYHYQNPALRRTIAGIHFQNPVGLAAGFDKNAQICAQLSDLGDHHLLRVLEVLIRQRYEHVCQ